MLVRLYNRQLTTQSELRRIRIILHIHNKPVNFSLFARELGYDRETISCWYYRIREANKDWPVKVVNALNEPGHAGEQLRRQRIALQILSDNPRSGAPCRYSVEQYTGIVALALKFPSEFDRPITHWSARELTEEIHKQEIAPGISQRQVQRFLNQADLKPHRSEYWLNPKIDDRDKYEKQIRLICDLYIRAPELFKKGIHLISTDEKTGIQALKRIAPAKPMIAGKPEKIEFEYKRHGTLCLIPSFEVATGEIMEYYIGDTRNEADFANHIASTVAHDPEAQWIFVSDQLNTHMSESLVRMVARSCGYEGDLGQKNKTGILKNIDSRREFLSSPEHRIRFVYTPKHCSWVNQVEIWFGILVRKVLKRGNFSSKIDLKKKIEAFISYFNRTMAKPYKWTCKGVPITA